jgi:hypothetical protein
MIFQSQTIHESRATSPDAYAGDVHNPASQKPFMWNNNNPVQFSDPSGYYWFGNGTPPEQNAWVQQAQALDALVEKKLTDPHLDPTVRRGLEALHQDLQPGGNWEVTFKPISGKPDAETFPNLNPTSLKFGSPPVAYSVFDSKKLSTEGSRAFQSAISTEGGSYEIDSGHVGPAIQSQANGIYAAYYKNNTSGPLGNLSNELFNGPLGLNLDHP